MPGSKILDKLKRLEILVERFIRKNNLGVMVYLYQWQLTCNKDKQQKKSVERKMKKRWSCIEVLGKIETLLLAVIIQFVW